MLKEMLEFQLSLQEKFYPGFNPVTMTNEEKIEMSKHYVLCAHEELTEIMSEMKHKNWHTYDKVYNEDNIRTEIVDNLKYILNMALLWGMNSENIKKVFDEKSVINLERYNKHE